MSRTEEIRKNHNIDAEMLLEVFLDKALRPAHFIYEAFFC
jgi:hypothetical protein